MSEIELAGCILTDSDDRVLLLHRNTSELVQWEVPGGKVKPGEDPADAAARETAEELGVSVVTARFLGETSFEHRGEQWYYRWYRGEIVDGGRPEVREPHLHDGLEYINLKRLYVWRYYPLSPGALAFMKLLQDGEIQL